MVDFKYCEVKFFKEQDIVLSEGLSKQLNRQALKSTSRQVEISFFHYEWSEDRFEEKCIEMLEIFQKRHVNFELIDGCLDFSKDNDVSLSFSIAYNQKMSKSQIKGLKQEFYFLVQSLSEPENVKESADSLKEKPDGQVQVALDLLKTNYEESQLHFEETQKTIKAMEIVVEKEAKKSELKLDKMQLKINNLVDLGQMNKFQIEKLAEKMNANNRATDGLENSYWKDPQQFFAEGNQKLLTRFNYLIQAVDRLEGQVLKDQKKIGALQETNKKMVVILNSIEKKVAGSVKTVGNQPESLIHHYLTNGRQSIIEQEAAMKKVMDAWATNLTMEYPDGKSNKLISQAEGPLDTRNSLNHREIKMNQKQQIALASGSNPFAKEHEACQIVFSDSTSKLYKNKKIKVSKEEFSTKVNQITFCEFNWANIASQFSKELFNLYGLSAYQERIARLSSFLDELNPNDYTIPFVSKSVLFVNRNVWEQLNGYDLLNQYLEHILNDHGLLIK